MMVFMASPIFTTTPVLLPLLLSMIVVVAQLQVIFIISLPAEAAWVNHGGGILNHRSARSNINAENAADLELRWSFQTGFDVSAAPSLVGRAVYFPGWDGNLYALNAHNGRLIWRKNLTRLIGSSTNVLSRTTPVVYKHLLLVGIHGPAVIVAVNRHSGSLHWVSESLDSAQLAVITMSGTAHDGYFYVGVSSIQEFTSVCCTFQGSFQKLRISNGTIVWKTSMVPLNSGYYGVAVWGSSPPIDVKRKRVYIATGNNYQVPKEVEECEANRTSENFLDTCMDASIHEDSILALDMDNGSIIWSRRLQGYDVWTFPCSQSKSNPNCPQQLGPDFDFGEAPILLEFSNDDDREDDNQAKCLVVCGQKSGVVWALDCDTGNTTWSTAAGPSGTFGGASWGSCTDGERVYTNIINGDGKNFTIMPEGKEVTTNGGWVAMNARNGDILWTRPAPGNSTRAYAAPSVTIAKTFDFPWFDFFTPNNVVIAPSFSQDGQIYVLDAFTGDILWNRSTGANIHGGGFIISPNCIFGGNGYNTSVPGLGRTGTNFTAFCLPRYDSWFFDPFSFIQKNHHYNAHH